MSLRLVAVSFDAHDPGVVGAFWGGMLGREAVEEARGVLVPGDETQVGLRFVEETTAKSRRSRLHLHLASATSDEQSAVVQAVLRLGGRRRGTKPLPKDRDIYMADPGGNEFCVIEPGNDYLAGCGLLAEVTCDGSRQVGRFWRDALGWSIVWDQGDQLAIQSPAGGTKIASTAALAHLGGRTLGITTVLGCSRRRRQRGRPRPIYGATRPPST